MPKSPAERKAAQRARQSAAGERKFEVVLDEQKLKQLDAGELSFLDLITASTAQCQKGRLRNYNML
ncbi:Uncharacterised protein [Klebsiella pneumoniae]|uniref:hypothetical protein n=1 Tax=Klebsiella pneumoniae TaxID=573 RepID=UPI000E2D2623|nr:hypothetical protein [Klebsiella pneumoniae]SVK57511.1 Uncharacterised protein [Klebsiella pneumoniae]